MKRIKLQIDNTLFCQIDLKNINPQNIQDLSGMKLIQLARIDVCAGQSELEVARDNGSQIVYALLSVEHRIESILAEYLFGPISGVPKPKKDFFVNDILQSSKFDYSFKKELLNKVINDQNLLIGEDKDILQKNLGKIMTWRNAFAHGNLRADNAQICYLEHYSVAKATIILSDEFWLEVEDVFKQINELLKKIRLNGDKDTIE